MRLLENKELMNIQFVLFLDNNTNFKAIDVSKIISDRLSDIFPDDPNIINNNAIQNNPFNAVIPRISFNNNKYILNIARTKIDFIYNNISKDIDYKKDLLPIIRELIEIFKKLRFIIQRIGIVVNFTIPKKNHININIEDYDFLSESKSYHEINLSWLEKFEYNGTKYNKWIRFIKTFNNQNNDIVALDINTLPEIDLFLRQKDPFSITTDIINYIEEEI